MAKDYIEITKSISANLRDLRKDQPEMMQGFSAMAAGALKDGALSKKMKELIALAIGISTRCDGCIGFHAEALVRLGATKAEVEEAIGMAVYLGGGPSLMYAADAMFAKAGRWLVKIKACPVSFSLFISLSTTYASIFASRPSVGSSRIKIGADLR